jgi:hypothetical protein
MRLYVTGPPDWVTGKEFDKLQHLIRGYRMIGTAANPPSHTLLHSGHQGVEAAAVTIARELGWEVVDLSVKFHVEGSKIDRALILWSNSPSVKNDIDIVCDFADDGIPVDVRHL